MATPKERAIEAEMLKDPEYRAAWDAYKAALAAASEDIQHGLPPDPAEISTAAQQIFALLDRRPNLVALVEMAESQGH